MEAMDLVSAVYISSQHIYIVGLSFLVNINFSLFLI